MAKYRITQVRSKSCANKRQIKNLEALGLHKMHHTVELEATPVAKGMIERVKHLVTVEEI